MCGAFVSEHFLFRWSRVFSFVKPECWSSSPARDLSLNAAATADVRCGCTGRMSCFDPERGGEEERWTARVKPKRLKSPPGGGLQSSS